MSNFDHLGCIRKVLVCYFQENCKKYMLPSPFLTCLGAQMPKIGQNLKMATLTTFFTHTFFFVFVFFFGLGGQKKVFFVIFEGLEVFGGVLGLCRVVQKKMVRNRSKSNDSIWYFLG